MIVDRPTRERPFATAREFLKIDSTLARRALAGFICSLTVQALSSIEVAHAAAQKENEGAKIVAILDTGAQEAKLKSIGVKLTPGKNFIHQRENIKDYSGHGTEMIHASFEAACSDTKASDCNVSFMPLKIAGSNEVSGSDEDISKAIDYATDNGADAISFAFVGPHTPKLRLLESIKKANKQGVIFVGSAGNDGSNHVKDNPLPWSAREDGIWVAAHDSLAASTTAKLLWFSNHGDRLATIAAYGGLIKPFASWEGYQKGKSMILGGTSSATAEVAGTVARLESMRPNSTALFIRNLLLRTGLKVPGMDTACGCILDTKSSESQLRSFVRVSKQRRR